MSESNEDLLAELEAAAGVWLLNKNKYTLESLRDARRAVLKQMQPTGNETCDSRDAARYRFIREQMTKTSPISYYSMPHALMFLRGVTGPKVFDQEVDARMNGAAFEDPSEKA